MKNGEVKYRKLIVTPANTEEDAISRPAQRGGLILHFPAPQALRDQLGFTALRNNLTRNFIRSIRRECGKLSGEELYRQMSSGRTYTTQRLAAIRGRFSEKTNPQVVREADYALARMREIETHTPHQPELRLRFREDNEPHTHTTEAITITLSGKDWTETTRFFLPKQVECYDILGSKNDRYGEEQAGELFDPDAPPAFAPRRLDIVKAAPGVWHSSPGYVHPAIARLSIAAF